jgi:PncC family amidohydrolase
MLGVPNETLETHGAVSEPVVIAMAQGARQRDGAEIALSISGIAGPDGGTPQKPVGTVCIGLAHHAETIARTFHFSGDREMVRDRSAKMALAMLRYHLLKKPMPF